MQLTDEHLAIVHHDLNAHAKVLAIAGACKTTTMLERVEYLVRQGHVHERAIRGGIALGRILGQHAGYDFLQIPGLLDAQLPQWSGFLGGMPSRILAISLPGKIGCPVRLWYSTQPRL